VDLLRMRLGKIDDGTLELSAGARSEDRDQPARQARAVTAR
jgi:hypothetical protein